jgi:hypothetical protein
MVCRRWIIWLWLLVLVAVVAAPQTTVVAVVEVLAAFAQVQHLALPLEQHTQLLLVLVERKI